jgi:hypothetical protein
METEGKADSDRSENGIEFSVAGTRDDTGAQPVPAIRLLQILPAQPLASFMEHVGGDGKRVLVVRGSEHVCQSPK